MKDINLSKNLTFTKNLPKSSNFLNQSSDSLTINDGDEEKQNLSISKTFDENTIRKNLRQERLKEKINKKKENKFDFFFMICIITMMGYLGKYGMNLLLDYILKKYIYKDDNYDKKLFMYYIMGLYAISLILSISLYQIFKIIFDKDKNEEKGNKDNKSISICQICGYIIYTEKKKPENPPKKNCCRLCCENLQNCCNKTFCYLLSIISCGCCFDYYCCLDCCCCCGEDVECCECCSDFVDCCSDIGNWFDNPDCFCSCICKKCKYDPNDYGKK